MTTALVISALEHLSVGELDNCCPLLPAELLFSRSDSVHPAFLLDIICT